MYKKKFIKISCKNNKLLNNPNSQEILVALIFSKISSDEKKENILMIVHIFYF